MTEVDGVRQAGGRARGGVMKRLHKAKVSRRGATNLEANILLSNAGKLIHPHAPTPPATHTHKEKAIYIDRSDARAQTGALCREPQTV